MPCFSFTSGFYPSFLFNLCCLVTFALLQAVFLFVLPVCCSSCLVSGFLFKVYYLACLSILGLGSSPSCVLISLIVHSPNVMLFSFNHTILLCPSLVIKTMIEAGLTAQDFESMQLPFPGYLFIYCSKKKFMLFFHLFVLVMT